MPKPPSAAQSLYPNLRQGTPEPVEQQRLKPTTAQSMYPGHPSLAPKPQRRLSPDELKTAWFEYYWSLMGIRRKS